jgi:hypothetical protein
MKYKVNNHVVSRARPRPRIGNCQLSILNFQSAARALLRLFLCFLAFSLQPLAFSQTTPVLFSTYNFTGQTLNNPITITAMDPLFSDLEALFAGPPITLQPVGGIAATNLVPGDYRVVIQGIGSAWIITVPLSSSVVNAAAIPKRGVESQNVFLWTNALAGVTVNLDQTNLALVVAGSGTAVSSLANNGVTTYTVSQTGSGGGTVTSVDVAIPGLTSSGAVTTSGTVTLSTADGSSIETLKGATNAAAALTNSPAALASGMGSGASSTVFFNGAGGWTAPSGGSGISAATATNIAAYQALVSTQALVGLTNIMFTNGIAPGGPGGDTMIGINAGQYGGRSHNVYEGYQAGRYSTNAQDTRFVGWLAGQNATYIESSTLSGYEAGENATNASVVHFEGDFAGQWAAQVSASHFDGPNAGQYATNASASHYDGNSAGQYAYNANNAHFDGANAGQFANAATYAHFDGQGAGQQATNATVSHFDGTSAGQYAANARYAHFDGGGAGLAATNSNSAHFDGLYAGAYAPNAPQSIFDGLEAGMQATNANNSLFLGANTGAYAVNSFDSQFLGFFRKVGVSHQPRSWNLASWRP